MDWTITHLQAELERLLRPGLIGFYESFDVIEIVGFAPGKGPTNILTLFVAETAPPPESGVSTPSALNSERIEIKGTDWKFGIFRFRVSTRFLSDVLQRYAREGVWQTGPKPLSVGPLSAVLPQFVHSNFNDPHPWNSVLKNNFWEGSHVLELFDTRKDAIRFLMRDSRLLTELSERIRTHVPIDIDGLSDRLGNMVLQFPVTVISTAVRGSKEGDQNLRVVWHSAATPRPLRISCEIYDDFTLDAFDMKEVGVEPVKFGMRSPGGGARTLIWDDANNILLGASPVQSFLLSTGIRVDVADEEDASARTREFLLPNSTGGGDLKRIQLETVGKYHFVGSSPARPRDPWRGERMFKLSARTLSERKEFVQYGHVTGAMREQALDDIRWLIIQHGKIGAWLWDPYLSASDILNTLFFCPHKGADLRALSNGDEPPEERGNLCATEEEYSASTLISSDDSLKSKAIPRTGVWKSGQHAKLNEYSGNRFALALEFRVRSNGAGWPFHDRFLIFPRENGPALAWSLGTSVNSLGTSHHILQKVGNGELVHNAFLSLWDRLTSPDHLVWKS